MTIALYAYCCYFFVRTNRQVLARLIPNSQLIQGDVILIVNELLIVTFVSVRITERIQPDPEPWDKLVVGYSMRILLKMMIILLESSAFSLQVDSDMKNHKTQNYTILMCLLTRYAPQVET